MSLEGGDPAERPRPASGSRRSGGGRVLLELEDLTVWDSPTTGPLGGAGVELSGGRLDRDDVDRLIEVLEDWRRR